MSLFLCMELRNDLISANKWPCNPTSGHISGKKHDPKRHMCPSSHGSTVYNSQDMHACKLSNFSCVQLFVTLCAEPCWISQARILEWVVSPSPLNLPDSGIETTSLTSAKTWKQPICPLTEEWIKMWYIYTVEYYFEKEWNYVICSNMYGPRECHTDWSKSDREGKISNDIPYMWNLKRNDINELTKQREAHRFRKQIYGCQGEGIVRDFGSMTFTQLNSKWITNKDLL